MSDNDTISRGDAKRELYREMKDNPKCPYCGGDMKEVETLAHTFYWACVRCNARSPHEPMRCDAYAAAMKRENKYREQVEYDVKAALNALNVNSRQMPYHIYSMLYDQISAIGYAPNCGAEMRKEAKDE